MQKYKSITEKDIKELEILRLKKILPLFLNDRYDNIIIFDTEDQEEFYHGNLENVPKECYSWIVESWDLQLIKGEPFICFNATWNDWDE